jgi:hypothetical protein
MGSIDEKTEGKKSRDTGTVPFKSTSFKLLKFFIFYVSKNDNTILFVVQLSMLRCIIFFIWDLLHH